MKYVRSVIKRNQESAEKKLSVRPTQGTSFTNKFKVPSLNEREEKFYFDHLPHL